MFPSPTKIQIRTIRDQLGWSQADAAFMVSVTTRAWQWWESGKRIMPALCDFSKDKRHYWIPSVLATAGTNS